MLLNKTNNIEKYQKYTQLHAQRVICDGGQLTSGGRTAVAISSSNHLASSSTTTSIISNSSSAGANFLNSIHSNILL